MELIRPLLFSGFMWFEGCDLPCVLRDHLDTADGEAGSGTDIATGPGAANLQEQQSHNVSAGCSEEGRQEVA